MSFGKKEEQIFLGREIAQHRDYSESTAIRIDEQVYKLVQLGYERAKTLIEERGDALARIAEALLEREVLDGAEVKVLIDGGTLSPLDKPKNSEDPKPTHQILRPDGNVRLPGLTEGQPPLPA
jgi:cell division protease FtsH